MVENLLGSLGIDCELVYFGEKYWVYFWRVVLSFVGLFVIYLFCIFCIVESCLIVSVIGLTWEAKWN